MYTFFASKFTPFTTVEQCTDKALSEHAQFFPLFFLLLSDSHLVGNGGGIWLQVVHHGGGVRTNQLPPGVVHDLGYFGCTAHSIPSNDALVGIDEKCDVCVR